MTLRDVRTRTRSAARRGAWMAAAALVLLAAPVECVRAQVRGEAVVHQRGRIWEELWNNGQIGDPGAWDYLTTAPLGMFPGFKGFSHPVGGEMNAINTFTNANFHNFRSGLLILARDIQVPDVPPGNQPKLEPYEIYHAGLQSAIGGIEAVRAPTNFIQNYGEESGFNPLLPEEMAEATWHTGVGVTVTRRSYVWSYPGYSDFIIYDYIFRNTGQIVSRFTQSVVPNTQEFQQTLQNVYFAFHSGISVSTKSQINFHSELTAVQAGGFGWLQPYHDYYHVYDDGALVFATNNNGGKKPLPFDPYPLKQDSLWQRFFPNELQSPAAFGWLTLHASPTGSTPRASARPDVLRIDTHKGGTFEGQSLDLERFNPAASGEETVYRFMSTPSPIDPPGGPGNPGDRFNFFTQSFGPYTLAPGDSVRVVIAEIAGVMDYAHVNSGDPNGYFPDSSIAAIRANAELARNAVAWGLGAVVDGRPLAADAPEPPPAPAVDAVNASRGTEEAAIAVTWDDVAETTQITDGSGGTFYSGLADLDGYRVYRSQDFQYDPGGNLPVLRGAEWTLLADIPKAAFDQYWDAELGRYSFLDTEVSFGERYGYYVSAYNSDPGAWTSANGTVVTGLGTLESGSHRRTPATSAAEGPVASLDVYAVPNPYVFGEPGRCIFEGSACTYRILFRNLPERATIRIYTIAGDLVRTIEHGPDARGNLAGASDWDQKTDSGLLVAPGVYIYRVESETEGVAGGFTGKLMIIR